MNDIIKTELIGIFKEAYSKDLCYSKAIQEWSEDNPARGMCAITALVLNDHFGGDIYKIKVGDESHYFNVIKGDIIDLTAQQFGHPIAYEDKIKVTREDMLGSANTKARYQKLKNKVAHKINNYS